MENTIKLRYDTGIEEPPKYPYRLRITTRKDNDGLTFVTPDHLYPNLFDALGGLLNLLERYSERLDFNTINLDLQGVTSSEKRTLNRIIELYKKANAPVEEISLHARVQDTLDRTGGYPMSRE